MKVIFGLFVVVLMLSGCFGSINQQSPTIIIPNTPRVLIKDIPAGKEVPKKMKNEESFSRPNLTIGYIENQAFPYIPRVWLLAGGQKVLLVGETIEGRPQVLDWQILEFSLPPGLNQVFIERWRLLPNQRGWQIVGAPEIQSFQVAKPRRNGWYSDNNYDWRIIIRQNRSFVSTGGRTGWYSHGRRGW